MRSAVQAVFCVVVSPMVVAQQVEPLPVPDSPGLLSIPIENQTVSAVQPQSGTFPSKASPGVPQEVVIPQDMPVQLRLTEDLSTVTDHERYVVHLEVASDVVADGVVVVPAGTPLTVRLTHAGSRIEFSEPRLVVRGQKLRLSEMTSQQRGELGAETGAAIGMAIIAAPLIAIQLPISAGYAVVHAARSAHRRATKQYVFMDKGETFTYYTRDRMRVKLVGH